MNSNKYVYERGNFLGELIGAVGGALMIALIVVLAFRFVWETFNSGSSETLKSISRCFNCVGNYSFVLRCSYI